MFLYLQIKEAVTAQSRSQLWWDCLNRSPRLGLASESFVFARQDRRATADFAAAAG
jgi:hypothetical protein